MIVLAILLIFFKQTFSAFINEHEGENIKNCIFAYLNNVCGFKLAADPDICSCRLCSEVCDSDSHSSDCSLQRRFGRCWNVSANMQAITSMLNETWVQRPKRKSQETLQQSIYVKPDERGANTNHKHDAGSVKPNDYIGYKKQNKEESKQPDSLEKNGFNKENSKHTEKTPSYSKGQSAVRQVQIETDKATTTYTRNSGEQLA